ncbi:Rossmann-like and DUF2520 domain-containing protein [Sphingopyxis panaciterrae]
MTNLPSHQFGIVGSGRVAQALALAFAPHSAAPPVLWGRSHAMLDAAVARIGRGVAAPSIDQLIDDCDIIAIAVADDAIASVAADMASAVPDGCTPFIFHVSGRSGAAILDPLGAAGAVTAAIHPAMTFTGDLHTEVRRMAEACFAITGSSPDATARARHIVGLLNGTAVEIAEDRRALYHAGLCHASNHLVTLIAGASHALQDAGVHDPAALLAPLVRAALENSLQQGFAALSGPLLRGDERTINEHLDALADGAPELRSAYRAMAIATLDELERTGSSDVPSRLRAKLS